MLAMRVVSLSENSLFDFVSFTGPDAAEFLQGQVTCDMQRLSPDRSLPGALCNLKGRVIADFRLLQDNDETIYLQCSAGIGNKVVETLSRYAVFSDVDLQLIEGPVAIFGIIGDQADALAEMFSALPSVSNAVISENDYTVVRMPGPVSRLEIWCYSAESATNLRRLDIMEHSAPLTDWIFGDIVAGLAHITADECEQHTPQLLNYDVSGVVDFQKGCYTGQEVVARMYYRGKAKKRLFKMSSNADLTSWETQQALRQAASPIAIISAVSTPDSEQQSLALGIVSTEQAETPQPVQATDDITVSINALAY